MDKVLLEKVLHELSTRKGAISVCKSAAEVEEEYNRSCTFAWAYYHIHIIDLKTVQSFIKEFAIAAAEVLK